MYDVIVVGAGPAGSTFARLVPKSMKIAIIDKRNLNEDSEYIRSKCCGGLLAPAAQKELAQQGLGIPGYLMTGPQTFSVKSIDHDNNLIRYYQRHYINIDREQFDRWLVSMISVNAETFFNTLVVSCLYDGEKYSIKIRKNNEYFVLQCRSLIAADGAASFIRSKIAPGFEFPSKYISIQDTYNTQKQYPYYFSIFDQKATDFYSWLIQKKDTLLFGSALPWNEDAIEKHDALAEKLVNKGLIEGSIKKRNGAIIYRPKRLSCLLLHKDKTFFIGEAAGLISPSSAEGISYALKSGRKLAEAFSNNGDSRHNYKKLMVGIKINIIYKILKSNIMYSTFLRKIVMKSGIISIDVSDNK